MIIQRQYGKAKEIYNEYPRQFWVLMGASFVDGVGGWMLFPFFTLYLTSKFGISMTQVGIIFGGFSIANVFGSTLGGALADRFGRKGMAIFGLVASALSSLFMGLVNSVELFFLAAVFVGLFAESGGPARQAMVADLLPDEKRAQGYGVTRVVQNLAVVVGPAIGGLLAARSFFILFVADAISSLITAGAFYLLMSETKPETAEGTPVESTVQTFRGYGRVLRDTRFMIFFAASVLVGLIYIQMNGTMAVFLRDVHGIPARGFGYIMTLNATLVVLFQFAITRRIEGYPPFIVLALGTALYAIGFGLFGFVSAYTLFLLAMAIITVGEMLVIPITQAVVAQMAPEDMRGRFMAVYGFTWIIPAATGITIAGLIIDQIGHQWVWYGAGLLGVLPVLIFLGMHRRTQGRTEPVPEGKGPA